MTRLTASNAARIGRDNFTRSYYDPALNSAAVARELGVPVHQLAAIAQELGVKTRKQIRFQYRPSLARTDPCRSGEYNECETQRHPVYTNCITAAGKECPMLIHCTYDNPPVLPCEVFVYFDEVPFIKQELVKIGLGSSGG